MIIVSTFRKPGGLADHLCRSDTNELVEIAEELSVGCALDVRGALLDFSALGFARGASKSLVHFAISPATGLSPDQEQVMMNRIRDVYAISHSHPCIVVRHGKPGNFIRPAHFHAVFPRVDGTSSKQISDSFSKIKNERISIELECDFGHALVPGPHIDAVKRSLAQSRPDLTAVLADLLAPNRSNERSTVGDKAFAAAKAINLGEFDRRVMDAFQKNTLSPDHSKQNGLALAQGDSAIMVVDQSTDFAQSLIRVLRRESKKRGQKLVITAAELDWRFGQPQLPTLSHVRRAGINIELQQKLAAVDREAGHARHHAAIDFERSAVKKLRIIADAEIAEAQFRARQEATKKADIAEIKRRAKIVADIRWQSIQRAEKRARFWHRHRKLAGLMAGTVALGGGFGIPIALMAIIVARGTIVFQRYRAQELRRTEKPDVRDEIKSYFQGVKACGQFDLATIPKAGRVAAGAIYRKASAGQVPDHAVGLALEKIAPGLPGKIVRVARYGSSPKVDAIFRRMFRPIDSNHITALAAFINQAAQPAEEKLMATAPAIQPKPEKGKSNLRANFGRKGKPIDQSRGK